MTINAKKNPTEHEIKQIIAASSSKTARKLIDESTGDIWVWDADKATHAQAAKILGAMYSRPPGAGDILVL